MMRQFTIVVTAGILLAGCAGVARDTDRIQSTSYVGDRGVVVLEEVVATTASEGSDAGFRNVHVVLAGVINPRDASLPRMSDKTGDVRDIITRLAPRIASAVVVTIQRKPIAAADLAPLREEILTEANRVFAIEFARWAFATDYEVRIVVTSLYFTTGSVGRAPAGRAWWAW